jgi:hypothetical protein
MDDFLSRTCEQLVDRSSGLFHFRLWIQPAVATILGVRAGIRDAVTHEPAYICAILSHRLGRRIRILSGWRDISRVAVVALVLDCLYQLVIFHWVYPLQAVIVAFALAIVPYVLVRGPVARVAGRLNRDTGKHGVTLP